MALSRESPRVAVSNHPALRSPDFPRRRPEDHRRGRPASSSAPPSLLSCDQDQPCATSRTMRAPPTGSASVNTWNGGERENRRQQVAEGPGHRDLVRGRRCAQPESVSRRSQVASRSRSPSGRSAPHRQHRSVFALGIAPHSGHRAPSQHTGSPPSPWSSVTGPSSARPTVARTTRDARRAAAGSVRSATTVSR